MSRAAAFLAHLGAEAVPAAEDLDGQLAEILSAARCAWPGVEVAEDSFLERLAKCLPAVAGSLGDRLAQLHAADLYLAAACAEGDRAAVAAFEAAYFGDLARAVASFDSSPAFADEIKQRLRQRLFVAEPGKPPKIAAYTGKGDLRRWLKVVATREAMAVAKKDGREKPADAAVFADRLAAGDDQELRYLKELYRHQFKAAFEEAFAALKPRERTVLRYQVIDGLNIDQIGAIYGVHRATVARWQQATRESLLHGTRDALMAKIEVGRGELDSILRLIHSQLDVSIVRLLRSETGGGGK